MARAGINVARRLIGGAGGSYHGEEIRQATREGSPPTLFRAVVLEVIFDPKLFTEDDRNYLKDAVTNPEFVETAPANSIIARLISNGQDSTQSSPSIFYPFFSSHMMMPVQAGEQVSIIFDDYAREGAGLGKWITRVSEPRGVEDPNFTHGDRRYDPAILTTTRRTSDLGTSDASNNRPSPAFPNGTGIQGSYSLQPSGSSNPFDEIYRLSLASSLATYEPVPRFTKRPQEFVIQGMNNSMIMLRQDRTGPALRVTGSAAVDKPAYAGSVDIVAGRGRNPLTLDDDRATTGKETSPLLSKNVRDKEEVDKVPHLRNRVDNPREGDPSFQTDAARIYVSMNTFGDTNFRIKDDTDTAKGIQYPDNTLKPGQPSAPSEKIGPSYVISKADHVRLIARRQTTSPAINGTILIIREGTKDDSLAYIYINDEAKIQLEAKKIYLGKATGEDEPYVYFRQYKKAIEALQTRIKDLESAHQSLCSTLAAAFGSSVAIPFSPVASLMTAAGSVSSNPLTNLQHRTNDSDIASAVNKSNHSTKIFGK